MTFFLFLLPFVAFALTSAMLLEEYLNSFGNDQFTTMDLPHVLAQAAPQLKGMAKAAGR